MAARFDFEPLGIKRGSQGINPQGINPEMKHRGDSFAVPEDEELENGAVQAALRGNAEALKRAARDQVCEHYEHLEKGCVYGCVDWYQYQGGEQSPAML